MWIREHQRPWTLGAIVAADAAALKRSLMSRLAAEGYGRAWLVVGGERGYWREERLCRRRDGSWCRVVDTRRGVVEVRSPVRPHAIVELDAAARAAIVRDVVAEGTIHARAPGLLLVGADVEAAAMYGLAGYRDLLDRFWQARGGERLARGTGIER
jgi:hypothetical protein